MELIPILSLIILVATISTFILAVGAYILYKIRERKGRTAQAAQPSAIPGELVAPAQLAGAQGETRRTIIEERAPTRESIYETRRYTDVREEGPEMRPTFVSPSTSSGSYSETKYQRPSGRGVISASVRHGCRMPGAISVATSRPIITVGVARRI